MKRLDLQTFLLCTSDEASQLQELLSVIAESAYDAVNDGTEDMESVLMRIKNLARLGTAAAQELACTLNDKSTTIGRCTPECCEIETNQATSGCADNRVFPRNHVQPGSRQPTAGERYDDI